ncbi:ATP-dependent zinc protease [Spongiibacter taiwanensis]|uniref:ATP-dependent zinc protease family protein n=1 Tax=Spongiibacter taiwanensis TaxID=1748242 RepID=UPI0020358761|nr:ATP-dependent zinc protease [Spongiibacter taiwanensis]USA41961.1 ATP-dependent zinc protease [Spongiibacter taiwanensis]
MALNTLGWREWLSLPDLGIDIIKAKVDTGARSSSLHAFDIQAIDRDGEKWVRFKVHPHQHDKSLVVQCQAPVKDYRQVTDSGGHRSMRYVIETALSLGQDSFPIEITLADRSDMLFRMLVGRTAMKGRFLVDPSRSYCVSRKPE